MKILLTPLRYLYFTYAALVFVICMLLVFPFVAVASFWGKMKGGDIIYKICRVWADVWLFLIGINHKNIFEYPLDEQKQYIFIINHISYLDIPVLFKVIRKRSIRVLGKAEMKSIPVFGYIYSRGAVMVDRNSVEQRTKSVRQLKSIIKKGISIVIFPEGTFNETHHPLKDMYDGAFRIAIETQTPVRPIIFLDTYDRMNYQSVLSLNPGRSRAIFLEEVSVDAYSTKEIRLLRQKVYAMMETKLREYHASWINDGHP